MNVTLNLSKEYTEPQIMIYAAEATEDIKKLLSYIQNTEKMITAGKRNTPLLNAYMNSKMEPSFNGMRVVLKNNKSDYISRKYLPLLKKRLGL